MTAVPAQALPSIVWMASLSTFKILGSQTPASFRNKVFHFPAEARRTTAAIFVDVLRATTTLTAVAAAGCNGIYVDVKPESGSYLFEPPSGLDSVGPWVYGGELNGQPIVGVDALGKEQPSVVANSLLGLRRGQFADLWLRFYSTNGTRAFREQVAADVMSANAMCVTNIASTVESVLATSPDRIWVTCGGFYGSSTVEDSVAGGLAVALLLQRGYASLRDIDDEALCMLRAADAFSSAAGLDLPSLIEAASTGQSGRLLRYIGREMDVPAALQGEGVDSELWTAMHAVQLCSTSATGPLLMVSRGTPEQDSTAGESRTLISGT